jgi:hypothetical protein
MKAIRMVTWMPAFFLFAFGSLLIRARSAFGEWPRYSANDPWALVNRAPQDGLHSFLSYSGHVRIVYGLFIPLLVGTLLLPFVVRRGWGRWAFAAAAAALLAYDNGRFLVWFLD